MEECVACKAKNVKQESINLLYLVYLVNRTTLKDQIDIKVSTLLRNVCEEEQAEVTAFSIHFVVLSRVRDASERMALAEPEKKRRLELAETSSSPSSSTPPDAKS